MSARTYLTHEIVLRVPTQSFENPTFAQGSLTRSRGRANNRFRLSRNRSPISYFAGGILLSASQGVFRLRLLWWCPACSFCLFFSLSAAGRTMQLRDIPARLLAARRVFSWFRFGFALVRDVEVDVPAPVCLLRSNNEMFLIVLSFTATFDDVSTPTTAASLSSRKSSIISSSRLCFLPFSSSRRRSGLVQNEFVAAYPAPRQRLSAHIRRSASRRPKSCSIRRCRSRRRTGGREVDNTPTISGRSGINH